MSENAHLEDELRRSLLPAVMALYLCEERNGTFRVHARGGGLGGGSAIAVNTGPGQMPFVLTCDHVVREFEKLVKQEAGLFICASMNHWMFRLDPLIVLDQSKDLDVASFVCRPKALFPHPPEHKKLSLRVELPVSRPLLDDVVIALGFPGVGRSEHQNDHVWMPMQVDSISDRGFVCAPRGGARRLTTFLSSELIHENMHLGGMSGAPIFSARGGSMKLVGLFRGGNTPQDPVFCSSLEYFTNEGKLDWPRVPLSWP